MATILTLGLRINVQELYSDGIGVVGRPKTASQTTSTCEKAVWSLPPARLASFALLPKPPLAAEALCRMFWGSRSPPRTRENRRPHSRALSPTRARSSRTVAGPLLSQVARAWAAHTSRCSARRGVVAYRPPPRLGPIATLQLRACCASKRVGQLGRGRRSEALQRLPAGQQGQLQILVGRILRTGVGPDAE